MVIKNCCCFNHYQRCCSYCSYYHWSCSCESMVPQKTCSEAHDFWLCFCLLVHDLFDVPGFRRVVIVSSSNISIGFCHDAKNQRVEIRYQEVASLWFRWKMRLSLCALVFLWVFCVVWTNKNWRIYVQIHNLRKKSSMHRCIASVHCASSLLCNYIFSIYKH